MARQPLTAYLLARRVTSLAEADGALREFGQEVELPERAVAARLFVTTSPPAPPPWAAYLEGVALRPLDLLPSSSNGAILLVAAEARQQSRVVAFVFGLAGVHFLKRSWLERGFGLRCALNACFPRGMPSSALNSLRSIDSKAFDEVALDTRQLASRDVGFEVFGMNIRTDLLRAVVGQPVDEIRWGSRVRGHDSFAFSASTNATPTSIATRLLRLWFATDYREHFPWVDNIKPVGDEALIADLETAAVAATQMLRLDLVGPEELDLDRTRYYRIRGDVRSNKRYFLDLRSYVQRAGTLTIALLKRDWVKSYDDDERVVSEKSVFECLAGDLTHDGSTYVVADGTFYAVDRNFLRELDRDISQLPLYQGLPDSRFNESEANYNARASAASTDLLLLDSRTIRLDGRTTPVEPCDLFSRAGALIHVKRNVRSSTLSHLFSQGTVAGELLMTSDSFRSELRELLQAIEEERIRVEATFPPGVRHALSDTTPDRHAHEVVFAIVSRWGNRSPAQVLPFFSKLNLRQRADELSRLGLDISLAKVNQR